MIIKLYHPDNTIKIIEDVSNVVVHMPMFSFSSVEEFNSEGFGIQDNHGISIHYPPYNEILDKNDNKCKFVDYISKDGFPMRLCVMELAYICNDHGKTIETVATKR